MSNEDGTRPRSSTNGRHNEEGCLAVGKAVRTRFGKEPMGYVSFRSETYISLGMVETRSHFSLVRTHGHHDSDCLRHHGPYGDSSYSTSARHCSPSQHHSCVLLFYDHAMTILTTLTTHILSYLSLTLPGLNLDPHSFDYSFLSCLCSFLFSPPHSLCNRSIFTYDVSSLESLSAMATLVYIV